jgi:nicotinate-nucleotide adenylyltransferase
MDFLLKAGRKPARVGILAGSFNPVTRAHMALARSALAVVDEVALVMPRRFPHKDYDGVPLAERIELVRRAASVEEGLSVAITDGGLFLEIAREARPVYPGAELWFLCGRDAAERIVGWNYRGTAPIEQQLAEYGLLVADRQGSYQAPEHLRERVCRLPLEPVWDDVSATEVRRRIAAGEPWQHLVPESVVGEVARLYGGQR